jgi:hypothetical protein
MCALQLSCPAHADTARPPLGLTESLQEGQRKHSSDLERAESLVRSCAIAALPQRPVATCILQTRGSRHVALAVQTFQLPNMNIRCSRAAGTQPHQSWKVSAKRGCCRWHQLGLQVRCVADRTCRSHSDVCKQLDADVNKNMNARLSLTCSPDTYTHYAAQDGVHAMFTGEISDWPGIDMMSAQHDGERRQLPGSLRLQHEIMPCMSCSLCGARRRAPAPAGAETGADFRL